MGGTNDFMTLWRNMNDPINRSVVLLINLFILAYTTSGSEITNGNFGAARTPVVPRSGSKTRSENRNGVKSYPYYGTLDSVDPAGKFLLLKGKSKSRQILISPETKIWKEDQKALLKDGQPGNYVSGSVHKTPEGREEAGSVRFAEKPPHKTAENGPKPD